MTSCVQVREWRERKMEVMRLEAELADREREDFLRERDALEREEKARRQQQKQQVPINPSQIVFLLKTRRLVDADLRLPPAEGSCTAAQERGGSSEAGRDEAGTGGTGTTR